MGTVTELFARPQEPPLGKALAFKNWEAVAHTLEQAPWDPNAPALHAPTLAQGLIQRLVEDRLDPSLLLAVHQRSALRALCLRLPDWEGFPPEQHPWIAFTKALRPDCLLTLSECHVPAPPTLHAYVGPALLEHYTLPGPETLRFLGSVLMFWSNMGWSEQTAFVQGQPLLQQAVQRHDAVLTQALRALHPRRAPSFQVVDGPTVRPPRPHCR
jgi:hypothetical protein